MRALTDAQRNFLLYGPLDGRLEGFNSEEEVIAAWERHREELLAQRSAPGRRPWGWRAIDEPDVPWRGYDRERAINWRSGKLGAQEMATLEAEWHKAFERAQKLDAAAAKAHLEWADVPHELIKRWTRQRSRKKEELRATAVTAQSSDQSA
jgi:hypothetical protein